MKIKLAGLALALVSPFLVTSSVPAEAAETLANCEPQYVFNRPDSVRSIALRYESGTTNYVAVGKSRYLTVTHIYVFSGHDLAIADSWRNKVTFTVTGWRLLPSWARGCDGKAFQVRIWKQ